jgi:hypothetical protein
MTVEDDSLELKYQLTLDDYYAHFRHVWDSYYGFHPQRFNPIPYVLMQTALVVIFFLMAWQRVPSELYAIPVIATVLNIIAAAYSAGTNSRKSVDRRRQKWAEGWMRAGMAQGRVAPGGSFHVTFDRNGFVERWQSDPPGQRGEDRVSWPEVAYVHQSPTHLFYAVTNRGSLVVPISAFADDKEFDRFGEMTTVWKADFKPT